MSNSNDSSHPPKRARHFLTGLLTIIPLSVTVIVLVWLVQILSKIGKPVATALSEKFKDLPKFGKIIESDLFINCMSVLVVIAVIYFIGMMANNFLGRWLFALFDKIMAKIPFVASIYGSVKKLVDLMRQDSGNDVQRVVLISFPSQDMKTVGLVTRMFTDSQSGRKLAAVYVPTTPNPTNGYLEIVPAENIVSTDWSMDEAMKFIISGGAVAPDRISYDKSILPEGETKLDVT